MLSPKACTLHGKRRMNFSGFMLIHVKCFHTGEVENISWTKCHEWESYFFSQRCCFTGP